MTCKLHNCPRCRTVVLGDDTAGPCPVCGAATNMEKDEDMKKAKSDERYVCVRCGERTGLEDMRLCPKCGAVHCADCAEDDPFCDECDAELD
jgi:rubrerythrin